MENIDDVVEDDDDEEDGDGGAGCCNFSTPPLLILVAFPLTVVGVVVMAAFVDDAKEIDGADDIDNNSGDVNEEDTEVAIDGSLIVVR